MKRIGVAGMFVAALSVAVLAGCALPKVASYGSSPEVRAQAEKLKTTDPTILRERWGDLAQLASKSWLYRGSDVYGMEANWIVPGAVMHIAFTYCNRQNCIYEWDVQYSAEQRRLEFITKDGELDKMGFVQADGAVISRGAGGVGDTTWRFDTANRSFIIKGGVLVRPYKYDEVSREQLVAAFSILQDKQRITVTQAGAPTPATGAPKAGDPSSAQAAQSKKDESVRVEATVPAKVEGVSKADLTRIQKLVADAKAGNFGPKAQCKTKASDITDFHHGTCKNGLVEGIGIAKFEDQSLMVGNFRAGLPNGYGIVVDEGGSLTYAGFSTNGHPHGKGKSVYPDGGIYIGDFVDGKPHGKGDEVLANGHHYVGEYANGVAHGKGEHVTPTGNRYVGDFSNGVADGKGEISVQNGDHYIGEWKDGRRQGKGVYL